MPERKADRESGAYPQSLIIKRIEALVRGTEHEQGKQIADLFGAKPNFWTRRRQGNSDLSLAEISLLAEKLAPAQQGWPFLDELHQRALARGLAELAKEASAAHPQRTSPKIARSGRRSTRGG